VSGVLSSLGCFCGRSEGSELGDLAEEVRRLSCSFGGMLRVHEGTGSPTDEDGQLVDMLGAMTCGVGARSTGLLRS